MSKYIYGLHRVDTDHLAQVIADMQTLGTPSLRVVDCGDYYQAIEGNHRLAACIKLGITPDLIILTLDDTINTDTLDIEDLQYDETVTASKIAEYFYDDLNRPTYYFEEV